MQCVIFRQFCREIHSYFTKWEGQTRCGRKRFNAIFDKYFYTKSKSRETKVSLSFYDLFYALFQKAAAAVMDYGKVM